MRRAVLAIFLLLAAPAWAQPAGTVVRLQGHADARAGETVRDLAAGAAVEAGDVVRTGDRARLLIRFTDGTEVTLGEDTRLTVETYLYDAQAHSGNASLAVARGAFLLDSGVLPKLPGHPLTVKLPTAVIGLRGTRFWGGPLDGPWNVLLFEGAVTVSNAAGSVDLTMPGAGTAVERADHVPSTPLQWSEERIARAVATVTFER
ncbi:MAG: FecR domain-containing protein [Actinomycetota bacterium]